MKTHTVFDTLSKYAPSELYEALQTSVTKQAMNLLTWQIICCYHTARIAQANEDVASGSLIWRRREQSA